MKKYIKRLIPNPYPLSSRGFSLVELLTVIGIFAVIGTLSVSIITLTLRGTKKSELFGVVRESGNLVISQVTRNIRYAKSLDYPESCVPSENVESIIISSADNSKTEYSCSETALTVNGSPLIDVNTVSMTACSFTCSQQTVNSPPTITLQFSLMPSAINEFTETNVPIDFRTSVVMRNYNNL